VASNSFPMKRRKLVEKPTILFQGISADCRQQPFSIHKIAGDDFFQRTCRWTKTHITENRVGTSYSYIYIYVYINTYMHVYDNCCLYPLLSQT